MLSHLISLADTLTDASHPDGIFCDRFKMFALRFSGNIEPKTILFYSARLNS